MPLESIRPDARPKVQNLSTESPEKREDIFNPEKEIPEVIRTKIKHALEERPYEEWDSPDFLNLSLVAIDYKFIFPNDPLTLNFEKNIAQNWENSFNSQMKMNNFGLALIVALQLKTYFPDKYTSLKWPDNFEKKILDTVKNLHDSLQLRDIIELLANTKLLGLDYSKKIQTLVDENMMEYEIYIESLFNPNVAFEERNRLLEKIRIAFPEKYEEIKLLVKKILPEIKKEFEKNIIQPETTWNFYRLLRTSRQIMVLTADEIKI